MNTVVVNGDRRSVFASEDLPLSVGGETCHIVIPECREEGPVAYLGRDGSDFFIQPEEEAARSGAITCNGVRVNTSRWIINGDEVAVGTVRLQCSLEGAALRIDIDAPATGPAKPAPPAAPIHPPTQGAVISPVDFAPRWQTPPRRAGFTIGTRAVLLSCALIALVIGAWYVLTSRAVLVETTPTAEHVSLQGGLLTPKIGDNYLLRPGRYTVSAELEGYIDLEEILEVGSDTPATVIYHLEPLGTSLHVTSLPVDGATIVIDGATVGVTPLDGLQLSAGEHTIEVQAPLHLPFSTVLAIEPGVPPVVLEAELVPNWAQVAVASSPSEATVLLDRATAGSTPFSSQVEAGDHFIEIRRSGYKPARRRVQVIAGEPVELGVVRLEPLDGTLVVVSEPAGATVTIDSEYRGRAPLEIAVVPGTNHTVRLSLAGHETFSTDVAVKSGSRSEVRASLARLTGEVVFSSQPPGAQLLIDGEPQGTTGRTLELEARPHEIEIRLDGYLPFRTKLTPEPGLAQAVRAVLKQEGPAGMPQSIKSPQGAELVLVGPGRFTGTWATPSTD